MAAPSSTSPSIATSITSTTPSCISVTPGPNGYVPPSACNAYWPYNPSFPAAIAFTILFGVLTFAHVLLAILHRKSFCWVIIMGSAWELSAFILRTLGSRDQQSEGYSTASQILFLLAPLWINAFVYMTAGRLVWMLHPEKRIWGFKAMSLGKYFVWLDIFSFLVQGAGGMMMNPGNDANINDIGKKIYMSGVGVQEFFIFLFLALIVRFHLDALKMEQQGLLGKGKTGKWWKYLTYTLYAVLVLITMRIIFRLVEFSGGVEEDNRLPYEEGYALGLDAFPMITAILLLAVVHPGTVLKRSESEFPSRKERKVEKKVRKAGKKILKETRKGGVQMNPEYSSEQLGTSDERLVADDVKLGHVYVRDGQVAQF